MSGLKPVQGFDHHVVQQVFRHLWIAGLLEQETQQDAMQFAVGGFDGCGCGGRAHGSKPCALGLML